MKSKVLSILLSLMSFLPLSAQIYQVKLDSGLNVRVEVCADDIFRVRISETDDFPESLMERYGIVRTSWDKVDVSVKESSGMLSLATATKVLTVNRANGNLLSVLR